MNYLRNWVMTSVAFSALTLQAFAQAPANNATGGDQEEAATSDEIIVTGTRRLDRTLANSPVPVDVIGGEAIIQQGSTEINRVLNVLVPSFNFPQPSITDGTDVIRPATLRGLAPDQTLVLVNGKRRHPTSLLNINGSVGRGSAAVDLNLIPTSSIERIEVLRDGAAAQYGSDAIAGVINIVLKKGGNKGSISTTFGEYVTTLRGVPNVTGIVNNNGVFPLAPDGTFQVITDGERRVRDGATITASANAGIDIGEKGYFNITVEYRDRDFTNRSGADRRPNYLGTNNPLETSFNRINHRYGDAATEDINVIASLGYDFNDKVEFYGTVTYGDRNGESAGFNRRANDARNRDFAASTTTVIPFYPDGFLPLINTRLNDLSVIAGFKGTLADWNWDLSGVHGSNQFNFGVSNSFNTSFGGLLSQTEFDSGGLNFNQQTFNADIQRTFDPSFLDSISLAFGGEFRREEFGIRQGDLQSFSGGPFVRNGAPAGAQVFPGFQVNLQRSRNSFSFYVDVDTDITSWWNLAFAGRYERYSDFGSDVNGKVATRVALGHFAALRGAISTGFRAPSLHQQFFETTATNNVGGTLLEILTVPVSDPIAVALGSTPLRPGSSVNYSGGFVLTPFKGLSLTADYYRIRLTDRIVVSENLQGAAVVGILTRAGINNVSSARFFVNGLDTTTNGVDVVTTYRQGLGKLGQVNFTAAFNYNETNIDRIAAAPGPLATTSLILFGRLESLRIEQGQPRTKIVLSSDYSIGKFSATLRGTRYGTVLAPGNTAADDLVIQPAWLADLEFRYEATKNLSLALGANNLFDTYPTNVQTGARPAPFTGNFSTNNYFLPYSSFSPFGFNGRFLYGRIAVHW